MPDNPPQLLLEDTMDMLNQSRLRTSVIAARAKVGYHWLRNLKNGTIKNPGVIPLAKLYTYLANAR